MLKVLKENFMFFSKAFSKVLAKRKKFSKEMKKHIKEKNNRCNEII